MSSNLRTNSALYEPKGTHASDNFRGGDFFDPSYNGLANGVEVANVHSYVIKPQAKENAGFVNDYGDGVGFIPLTNVNVATSGTVVDFGSSKALKLDVPRTVGLRSGTNPTGNPYQARISGYDMYKQKMVWESTAEDTGGGVYEIFTARPFAYLTAVEILTNPGGDIDVGTTNGFDLPYTDYGHGTNCISISWAGTPDYAYVLPDPYADGIYSVDWRGTYSVGWRGTLQADDGLARPTYSLPENVVGGKTAPDGNNYLRVLQAVGGYGITYADGIDENSSNGDLKELIGPAQYATDWSDWQG